MTPRVATRSFRSPIPSGTRPYWRSWIPSSWSGSSPMPICWTSGKPEGARVGAGRCDWDVGMMIFEVFKDLWIFGDDGCRRRAFFWVIHRTFCGLAQLGRLTVSYIGLIRDYMGLWMCLIAPLWLWCEWYKWPLLSHWGNFNVRSWGPKWGRDQVIPSWVMPVFDIVWGTGSSPKGGSFRRVVFQLWFQGLSAGWLCWSMFSKANKRPMEIHV